MGSYRPVSKIAIVGAGPIGVCCAKYLLAEKAFQQIDIFEQRSKVGGIWNLSPKKNSKDISIPQLDPNYGLEVETDRPGESREQKQRQKEQSIEFESALYEYLETNIPKSLMGFSDFPFPEDEPLFPKHDAVLRYLEAYAEDVRQFIRFGLRVRKLWLHESSSPEHEKWSLEAEDLNTGSHFSSRYDAVVIANGHYNIPYVPDISGITQWRETYPNSIIHSKAYNNPEDFKDKKVLVIGNSASGLDIAFQVSQHCKKPVLLSSRSISAFGSMAAGSWKRDVSEVVEFLPSSEHSRAVRFKDGHLEEGIDSVIFATGYFYSYPFLSAIKPPVITNGFRVCGTYQHIINIDHPTLAFPVLNLKVIPFPLVQNQAAVIARVWSGRLNLPSKSEMTEWETDLVHKQGDGKYFHLKKFPEDAAQINELYDWAASAITNPQLENDGQGKLGTRWNERQVWMRSQFPNIKGAFSAQGEERHRVRTIEELGFDFDRWRMTATILDLEMFKIAKC